MASDDQLAEIRADIDSIDKQLLELINARAECARRVAEIKLAASQDGDALFPLLVRHRAASLWATIHTTIPALIVGIFLMVFEVSF